MRAKQSVSIVLSPLLTWNENCSSLGKHVLLKRNATSLCVTLIFWGTRIERREFYLKWILAEAIKWRFSNREQRPISEKIPRVEMPERFKRSKLAGEYEVPMASFCKVGIAPERNASWSSLSRQSVISRVLSANCGKSSFPLRPNGGISYCNASVVSKGERRRVRVPVSQDSNILKEVV